MSGKFGCLQKTAFVGMIIGSVFCLAGIVGPEWVVITDNYGGIYLREGLWTLNTEYLDAVQGCALTCLVTCGTCTIVALGMACCCQGCSTFCIGIFTFFSGIVGIIAAGIFIDCVEDFRDHPVGHQTYDYGWAFGLFLTGAIIVTFASIFAIFGSPSMPRATQVKVIPAATKVNTLPPVVANRPVNIPPPVVANKAVNIPPPVVANKAVNIPPPVVANKAVNIPPPVVANKAANIPPPVVANKPVNIPPPVIANRPVNVPPAVVANRPMSNQSSKVVTQHLAPGMYWSPDGNPHYPQYNNCVFAHEVVMIHNFQSSPHT